MIHIYGKKGSKGKLWDRERANIDTLGRVIRTSKPHGSAWPLLRSHQWALHFSIRLLGNKKKGGYLCSLKKERQPRRSSLISSPCQHAFLVFSRTKGEQVGLMQTCSCSFSRTMKRKQVGVFKLEKKTELRRTMRVCLSFRGSPPCMGIKHKSKQVEKEGTLPSWNSIGQSAGIKKKHKWAYS